MYQNQYLVVQLELLHKVGALFSPPHIKKTKFLGRISRFLLLYTYGVPFGVVVYSPTNYTPILLCPRNLELWDSAAPV